VEGAGEVCLLGEAAAGRDRRDALVRVQRIGQLA